MEPNNPPSSGSVADVQARLLIWARRAEKGFVRVEFTSETARLQVVHGLRISCRYAEIPFVELPLAIGKDPTEVVRNLMWRLEKLRPGVVSVTGFPMALPDNPTDLAAALYAFNFNREGLARLPQRQIWWMPPYFAEVFLRAVPDLDSWFLVKLQLTDAATPAPADLLRNGLLAPPVSSESPEDARRYAAQLIKRFEHALTQELPVADAVGQLLYPALAALRRAGLGNEAAALEERFQPRLKAAQKTIRQNGMAEKVEQAKALYRQATSLHDNLRFAEAESLYHEALALAEETEGPEHPDVALYLNDLAQLLNSTNRLAEAEPLMRRALAIDEQSFSKDHPNVARDLHTLASLLQDTNRLAEAEPLLRRALAIAERSFGKDHPNVAAAVNNLAQLLQAANRLAEAEPLLRRALAIDEQSYGKDHPDVARDLNNLALLLKATNRVAEAELMYRQALAIDERNFGPDHTTVAIRLNNLAKLLEDTNRSGEAEPLYRRAVGIIERSLGSDHPKLAIVLQSLGCFLESRGRPNEARPLLAHAKSIRDKASQPAPAAARCSSSALQ